jgi:YbgC/YbaW family acyl-CoA thioester hydrolase
VTSYVVELRERDIDVFGHVHYAEYLVFLAQARNAWLRDVGVQRPGAHVVARLEIDYRASARLADGAVRVEVTAEAVGRSSLALREAVSAPDGRPLVGSRSVIVRFDPDAGRVLAWTDEERQSLQVRTSDGPGL